MLPEKWRRSVTYFFFIFMLTGVSGSFVGINIGTDISNLPSESDIVSLLQAHSISHVRLFDADHKMLKALANTGIQVIIGVPNDQILHIGESRAEAANWIKQNVATFVPATNITHIAVGSEILTTIPNVALILVHAVHFLQSALVAADLNFQVKVSTPHAMGLILNSFPPSTATFNTTWNRVMRQLLHLLKNTDSPFMLNAQPYYVYTEGKGVFPLEYALFQPLTPNKQIVDSNTNTFYNNMFDAMVDATYYSMQALGFTGIPVLVTETGWPWSGGANEQDAIVDNALMYNTNLIHHVLNNSGTPGRSTEEVSAYIYELFNEDLLPGPVSKKNWGILFPNGTSVYDVSFVNGAGFGTNTSATDGGFCVANSSAGTKELKAGVDWACGPGTANCSAIQPGQPCFDDDLATIASYAYNDYYQRTRSSGGTCSFGNTAFVTTKDPSHGLCIFAGSVALQAGSTAAPKTAAGPVSAGTVVHMLEGLRIRKRIMALLLLLFISDDNFLNFDQPPNFAR